MVRPVYFLLTERVQVYEGANTFGVKYTIVDDLLGKSECETKCKSCQSWISKSIYKFHRSNLAYRPVNASFND